MAGRLASSNHLEITARHFGPHEFDSAGALRPGLRLDVERNVPKILCYHGGRGVKKPPMVEVVRRRHRVRRMRQPAESKRRVYLVRARVPPDKESHCLPAQSHRNFGSICPRDASPAHRSLTNNHSSSSCPLVLRMHLCLAGACGLEHCFPSGRLNNMVPCAATGEKVQRARWL